MDRTPVFLEINRKNFPQYVDHIKNTLQRSSVVSFAVHSTVCPDSAKWRVGESLQEHYLRLAKFSLNHSIFGLGISCLEYHPADEDPTKSSSMAVRNFNLTLGTAAASEMSPQDGRRMRQMGYDLNYVTREAVYYYRGKEDVVPNHLEESKMLRDIFIALHETVRTRLCLDVFSFVDAGSVDAKASGPNLHFPAVLDSFRNLREFSRRLGGDLSKTSLATALASYGNRLVSVAAPQPVQLQLLLPGSKFRPTKKRKIEFDFTIPLTASSNDAGISSSSDPLKPV
ncbi:hypothetical protein BV898_09925 [Hypsibius exemplaris]|uniref:Uncharacterized protein n=1 Tax=Hypsibius exemplaris TaxID=2072580 RepID=A0A1W0WLB1_HYPEX|nr:hypothetical protein BV898_09925 [Hypsibius exemplaris]